MHYLFYIQLGAFLLALLSLYFLHRRRFSWYFSFQLLSNLLFFVLFAAFALYCVTQDLEFAYIVRHSIPGGPLYLRLSSLWAGREGSLLLWVLILKSMILVRSFHSFYARDPEAISQLKTALVITLYLCAISLFFSSPFILAVDRIEGAGMNSALRSFWMTIHPPLLFIGYSYSLMLFSSLFASIKKKNPGKSQSRRIQRYTLLTFLFLSLGLASGGVWAYHSLGWGGFWGWDPVENLSLVPWLLTLAFIHLKARRKTPFHIFSVISGLMIFWSALASVFLTRSGLLSAVSVHSFQAGGSTLPYLELLLAITFCIAFSLFVLIQKNSSVAEERTLTYNAGIIFFVFALVVLFMTVFPLLLAWINGQQFSVSSRAYNVVSVFVLIVLSFMLALQSASFRFILTTAAVLLIPFLLFYYYGTGIAEVLLLYILALSSAALLHKCKKRLPYTLVHLGFLIMCAGLITAFSLSETARIDIEEDEMVSFAGKSISFNKSASDEITVKLGNQTRIMNTQNTDAPLVFRSTGSDMYINILKFLDSPEITGLVRLNLDQPITVGGMDFTYAGEEEGLYTIAASSPGRDVYFFLSGDNPDKILRTDNGEREIQLRIAESSGKWLLVWIEPDKNQPLLPPVLVLEVSKKPLIILLYAGIMLLTAACAAVLLRRKNAER